MGAQKFAKDSRLYNLTRITHLIEGSPKSLNKHPQSETHCHEDGKWLYFDITPQIIQCGRAQHGEFHQVPHVSTLQNFTPIVPMNQNFELREAKGP